MQKMRRGLNFMKKAYCTAPFHILDVSARINSASYLKEDLVFRANVLKK